MQPNPVNQSVIIENIVLYLRQKNRDEKLIREIEEGICAGITSLWLYSKWLQTQPNPDDKPIDNYAWFTATIKSIAAWDGRKETSPPEFERFISQIESLQSTNKYLRVASGNLDKIIEDTKGRKPKKEYSIASLLTLNQLKQLLQKEGVIQEDRLIDIGSPDHATGLFKHGGSYYFFNPNNDAGEVKAASADEVAKLIFDANFYTVQEHPFKIIPPDYNKPSPLGFRMFSFDDKPITPYPIQRDVLEQIKPTLQPIKGYALGYSGLDVAIQLDSVESVEYFLEKGFDPNGVNAFGNTPLMFAARQGSFNTANRLLRIDAVKENINQTNDNHYTALMLAVLNNNTEIAAILLERGADPNVASLDNVTALIFAAKNGNVEMVKMLLRNGANPNASNYGGKNALMYAVKNKHFEVAKILLQQPHHETMTASFATSSPISAIRMALATRKIKKTIREKTVEIEPQLVQQKSSPKIKT